VAWLGFLDESQLKENFGHFFFSDRLLREVFNAFRGASVAELSLLVLGVHHERRRVSHSTPPTDLFDLLDYFQAVKERHIEVKYE